MIFKEIQTLFKYCPNCKNELALSDNNIHCNKCGFDYYLTPNPGVVVILINKNNQIYFAKRTREPNSGFFSLPGGFVSFHESSEEAIKREVKEELGIDLENIEFFATCPDEYNFKGTKYNPLITFFISYTNLDFIDLSKAKDKELKEGQFLNLNEIPFGRLSSPSQEIILKKFVEVYKNKI